MGDFSQQKLDCLDLCSRALVEVKKEVLRVDTQAVTKNDGFSTKATVSRYESQILFSFSACDPFRRQS